MKEHRIFADVIEGKALSQFYDALKQPYVVKGALMADAHTGYSLPIGAVMATEGVIVPSWIGYDIGCGVCAVRTTATVEKVREVAEVLFSGICRHVPFGEGNRHRSPQKWEKFDVLPRTALAKKVWELRDGARQYATGGSGNHFSEIGQDEQGRVWIIIHSGSRGFGHGLATEYMKIAAGGQVAREGHYPLAADSVDGKNYIIDMNFALQYALDSRVAMLKKIEEVMGRLAGGDFLWDTLINRNHNHAEEKDGLWIHRKGATHAEAGMMGVIPGNMRDGSFLVEGKGNPGSLCSSSHGAGRVMGRRAASENLRLEDFHEAMRGVVAKVDAGTLDESPFAYKDIFAVMRAQEELVSVKHHIRPIINIKG